MSDVPTFRFKYPGHPLPPRMKLLGITGAINPMNGLPCRVCWWRISVPVPLRVFNWLAKGGAGH